MVSRRRFLQNGALVTVVSGPYFTGKVYAQKKADVAAISGSSIEETVRAAVGAVGGIDMYVKRGDWVALKPNLSFASPVERAATTNPEVLRALIKLCLDAGAKGVIVLDHPLQDAAVISDKADVAKMVKETRGASLILPTAENLYRETAIPKGKEIKSTQIAKILDEIDILINVPIAKHHSATAVSLSIKGNMGLVWNRKAYHNSADLNQAIADLATVIKPKLTIVDAIRALATRGPQGPGKVLNLNTIIAGRDPVAVDSYTVEFIWKQWELTGKNVEHLVKSSAMGVGEIDIAKLTIEKRTL